MSATVLSEEPALAHTVLTVGLFIATYGMIISDRVPRALSALAGAGLMIVLGILSQHEAIEAVDFNTIGLLVGMMIIVVVLRRTGIFSYLAIKTAKAAKGDPLRLLIGFCLVTAVASAFLDNVTTILLMAPIIDAITHRLKLPVGPFLITAVVVSNIGGTATLIGDPPNIIIGSATELSFNDFLFNLAPVVAIILALTLLLFWVRYRRRFRLPAEAAEEKLEETDERSFITDAGLLRRSLIVLGLTITGFVLHGFLGLEAATIALGGAVLVMLVTWTSPHDVLHELEWTTIFFFMGLFVLVGGLEKVGVLDQMARGLLDITAGNEVALALGLLWLAAVISAVVDNIPAVTTMVPMVLAIARLQHPEVSGIAELAHQPDILPLWWAMALGACLGGNGTLVAASANVVAAGIAERRGHPISFKRYFRIGAPVTLLSLVVASGYIYLRYLL